MAIEDARVLDRALDQWSSAQSGLRLDPRTRFERTARVVTTSTAMSQAYHQPNADAFREHSAAIREAAVFLASSPDRWPGEYDADTLELT